MLTKILLERSRRHHKRRTITPRTQPHVHPKHKAIRRHLIEQTDDATTKVGHEFLIVNAFFAVFARVTLAHALMDKNQINVAG